MDAPTISLDVSDCYDPTETVILGGGGVLKYSDRICKARHRVVWGAGVNRPRLRKSDTIPDLSEWDLIGIRDWNRGYPWVPCASCLHEVFDHPHDVTQEFVVMAGSPLEIRGLPSLRCNVGHQLTDIIRHLGSGETVVTSSYHGWYWATLLGRRVVVIPNSGASKFYHLRWPTPLERIKITPSAKWAV